MAKRNWNSEKFVSIAAIFISIITLTVFIYQTRLMHEQQRLSVMPYLSISNYGTGGPNYKLMVANNGIGPAFIESVKVTYKDEVYNDMDVFLFLYSNIAATQEIQNFNHSNIYEGQMIPAGEKIAHLEIVDSAPDADKLLTILAEMFATGDAVFEIVYASIYKEKWLLRSGDTRPTKIK